MPTVRGAGLHTPTLVETLDHVLGRILRPLANLVPRRLRRVAEKLERRRARPIGQLAALGFLAATVLYGLVVGGQIGRFSDWVLVMAGFGIEDVRIDGTQETSEIAILEQLDTTTSLINFDVADAQQRLSALPWVENVTVRKFYPGTLAIEIAERKPFALWQRDGEVLVMDRTGFGIVPLDESRFAKLPLMVGSGANAIAQQFVAEIVSQPGIASQIRAAVLVGGRRWDLHLDHGVTVKLPEKGVKEALAQLVKLSSTNHLLARDVVVIDLRLPDRVTVRLPEGRTLEEVTSEGGPTEGKTKT